MISSESAELNPPQDTPNFRWTLFPEIGKRITNNSGSPPLRHSTAGNPNVLRTLYRYFSRLVDASRLKTFQFENSFEHPRSFNNPTSNTPY